MKRIAIITVALYVPFTLFPQQQHPLNSLLDSVELKKDSNKVKALFNVSNYYTASLRLDSSKYYSSIALEEARKCGYEYGESKALFGLGYIDMYQGDYQKAYTLFQQSLTLKEKLGLQLEAAAVKDAIGRMNMYLREYDKAILNFLAARKIYEKYNDSARLLPLMVEMASYYGMQGNDSMAVSLYETSISVYDRWKKNRSPLIHPLQLDNYRMGVAIIYASMLIRLNNAPRAINLLTPFYSERKDTGGLISISGKLVQAYVQNKEYKKAIETGEKTVHYLKNHPEEKFLEIYKDLLGSLSEAWYRTGNYRSAFFYERAFKEINDSILNVESRKAITEMQTRYETAGKDKEIVTLGKQKKTQRYIILLATSSALILLGLLYFIIRAKKLQLKVFLQKEHLLKQEKEIETNEIRNKVTELEQMALRAQMNPHFIFNSLSTIQHLILKNDTEEVNKYLISFANLVRQTLHLSGKSLITLDEEIKYLSSYLMLEKIKFSNQFNYLLTVDEAIDVHTTYVPSMLLQPYVENAIKHGALRSKNKEGLVSLSFRHINGRVHCLIEDNGPGIVSGKTTDKSIRTDGHQSAGTLITEKRILAINKSLNTNIVQSASEIPDIEGSGTRIRIDLPADLCN